MVTQKLAKGAINAHVKAWLVKCGCLLNSDRKDDLEGSQTVPEPLRRKKTLGPLPVDQEKRELSVGVHLSVSQQFLSVLQVGTGHFPAVKRQPLLRPSV